MKSLSEYLVNENKGTKYSFDDFISALNFMNEFVNDEANKSDKYPNWGEFETDNEKFKKDLMEGADDNVVELLDEIFYFFFQDK